MIDFALITIIVQSCLFSTSDQNRLTTQNKLQNWVDGARTTFVVSVLLTISRVITIWAVFAMMFGLCKRKTKTILPNSDQNCFGHWKFVCYQTLTFCKQMIIEDWPTLRFDLNPLWIYRWNSVDSQSVIEVLDQLFPLSFVLSCRS